MADSLCRISFWTPQAEKCAGRFVQIAWNYAEWQPEAKKASKLVSRSNAPRCHPCFTSLTSSQVFTNIPLTWAQNATKNSSTNMNMLHPWANALSKLLSSNTSTYQTTIWNLQMASGLSETSSPLASSTCRIPLKWILPNTHAATHYTVHCALGKCALGRWSDTTLRRMISNSSRIIHRI